MIFIPEGPGIKTSRYSESPPVGRSENRISLLRENFLTRPGCFLCTPNTLYNEYLVTRVAQKVMPHIFFLGNCLLRMYEIHAQYNWMFPLHMLFFYIISI
jgi:hypothetical protein